MNKRLEVRLRRLLFTLGDMILQAFITAYIVYYMLFLFPL